MNYERESIYIRTDDYLTIIIEKKYEKIKIDGKSMKK